MFRLQIFQTPEHMVIIEIANGGIVQHIVPIIVLIQFSAELLDLLLEIHMLPVLLIKVQSECRCWGRCPR